MIPIDEIKRACALAELAGTHVIIEPWQLRELLEAIAKLEAMKKARQELRATQENWHEDCLFECDKILTEAIGDNDY